jgi:L-fucose isomerase-like protein
LHHPFEIVYGDPDVKEVRDQFDRSVRTASAVRRLKRSRIGLIGGHAPGYFAMAGDPFDVWLNIGLQLQSFSLSQFGDVVKGLDDGAVSGDVEAFKKLKIPLKDVEESDLTMASRLYLGMKHYYETEEMDALAVRCWPEMPNVFGQWPYVGMTRLAEEELPIGVEGDVDGALSGLLGKYLGLGPCYGSDWLEHDGDTITLWHGGNLPFSMSPAVGEDGGPCVAKHFNIRKPAVIESILKPGMPVTVMRLWRLEGQYHLMAFEGETVEPRRHLMGTNGLVRLSDEDPDALFRNLCDHGMPHHVAVYQGHRKSLFRSLARILGFTWTGREP